MAVRVDVDVVGLREFIREARKSPERLDLEIRKRFRGIAADVRDQARSAAEGQRPGGGRTSQRQHWRDLVNTIRSGSSADSPYVSVGTPGVPWALGFEFGSMSYHQFPPWRGNGQGAGYFLWPTVRGMQSEILEKMGDAVEEALGGAFPG